MRRTGKEGGVVPWDGSAFPLSFARMVAVVSWPSFFFPMDIASSVIDGRSIVKTWVQKSLFSSPKWNRRVLTTISHGPVCEVDMSAWTSFLRFRREWAFLVYGFV
ncbi:MAG: hypothetical protein IK131_09260 [Paludibacteraceae bacterium]|nr:hypothetical protein [Paludibacteraceae bacterium]